MLKLSVLIPAHNETDCVGETVASVYKALTRYNIEHEILVVNDHSTDGTETVLEDLALRIPTFVYYNNDGPGGFGYAIRYGLELFTGDCVAIMMADLSDSPLDLVRFYHRMIEDEADCVFGSRFIKGGKTVDYPVHKLLLNRLANNIIKMVIGTRYNDATNAFKLYRRETIAGLKPFLAPHFNLTIELSLKCIIRGYGYVVVPNSWQNRKHGISKLRIHEMGSRYFFILLYCFIEKFFSRGDFTKASSAKAREKRLQKH